MRALVWMLGLASFLACTTTASILIPIPSAPEAIAGSDPALADDADAASELEVAFRRLDENVGSIYSGLENALAGLELRTLEEHLRTSEMVSGANRIIVLDDIRLELERLVRESAGLDFLILCPPTGEALATGIDKPLSGQSLRRVREIAEPLFVARSPRTGIESLPDFLRRGTGPGMGEIYVPRDYVVSSRVVWARADTPAAVLLGGIDINRLRDAFERFDQGNDGVRTQLFVLADDRTFVICHGDERGERRAANAHLLRELETQDVARSSAFESGGATGMWRALRSTAGELSFVWGVTPNGGIASAELWELLLSRDVLIAVGCVAAGLAILWLSFWTLRRRSDWRGYSALESLGGRGGPFSADHSLSARELAEMGQRLEVLTLEVKRIADGGLVEKARDLEALIGREITRLREEVESVRKGIVGEHETLVSLLENRGGSDNGDAEPGAQLASVREAVDALRSEVERVALATDGAFASRLDSIEENLSRIASRSEEEPAPAPAVAEEWKAQAAALRKEIEDARALAEELLADLESARTTETALRAELEEIRRREGELDERLQAEVRARAETSARETLLAERAAELEKSERLARSELAQLRAAASAETRDSESGGDARDDERLLLLELELEEARAQGEAHSRRMGELEAEAQSLRESRDQLEQELSESRSALEAAENAIRGSERLAEKAGELESFIGELEKEREALHDQKIELEGQLRIARLENEELRANLDAQAAKAADQPVGASDIERLRGEVADIQDFQSALVQGDLSVALIAVDPELQVFVWNPAAERLFGIPSAEALGRSFYELGAGAADLVARLADEAKQSIKTGSPRSLDPRHFALRDREVWLDLRCEPITSSRDDRCLGALLAVSNVTENVENKVRLDAQERFLENLSRSIPVALVITDDRRRVVVWNRNAERILKLSRSEALGRDLLSLRCRLSESNFRDDFLAAEKAGKATRFHVAADTDEVQARYLVTFAPFRDDAEKRCGHLLLIERAAPTKVVSPQER